MIGRECLRSRTATWPHGTDSRAVFAHNEKGRPRAPLFRRMRVARRSGIRMGRFLVGVDHIGEYNSSAGTAVCAQRVDEVVLDLSGDS